MEELRGTSPKDGSKQEMTPGDHVVHPQEGVSLSLKDNGTAGTCYSGRGLEDGRLSERKQSGKDSLE